MKIVKKVFFLFMAFLCGTAFSQKKSLEELQEKHLQYFNLNREYVFIHLNKTKFAPNENAWFTAYSYDVRTMLPNAQTTNLIVSVFDAKGNQVETQTVFIENGLGNGQFILAAKKYTSGKYYLKASTNYMKNFREDLEFVQSFEILGKSEDAMGDSKKIEYDLQFLPEGGHFVADLNNTVGIKLIDQNGKGVFFTNGEILNSQDDKVSTFKANKFGISKFSITPEFGKTYKAVLKTEHGEVLNVLLPVPEKTGMTLKTNNLLPDEVVFSLQTNRQTYDNVGDQIYFLAFHQQNKFKGLKVKLDENDLATNVNITRDALFPGINTITVFDENYQPILERLIFNDHGIKRKTVTAELAANFVDSLQIRVKKGIAADSLQRLSISVLPKKTLSYNPKQNILSSFYLKPYIKSAIENGGYYFKNQNVRRRNYDLDLLLLTQGWSKYDWQDIFNNTPKQNYENEVGFNLSGQVNKRNEKRQKQLFLKSNESNLFEIVDIDDNDKFSIENIFVIDSTSISIGLMGKNTKVKKSSFTLSVLPFKKKDLLDLKPKTNFEYFKKESNAVATQIASNNFISNAVSLDSVMLKGLSKTEKRKERRRNSSAFEDIYYIDEDLGKSFQYISDFIATKGFQVNRDITTLSIFSRRATSFSGQLRTLVILDGMPLLDDLNLIQTLLTREVDSISFNKSGAKYGTLAPGGVIEISTKIDFRQNDTQNSLFSKKIKNGFAIRREFYTPKYSNYGSELFENYGVIDWQPSISLENKNATFKIPNTLTKEIILYIEGMSVDGYLISEEIVLKP